MVTGICDGWGIYQTTIGLTTIGLENHTHIGYGFFNDEIILNLILRVVYRNRNLRMDKFKDTCQMWVSSMLDRILPVLGGTPPPVWVLEYYYDNDSSVEVLKDGFEFYEVKGIPNFWIQLNKDWITSLQRVFR